MLFPVSKLIQEKDPPLCTSASDSVETALSRMIEHDYSQLPVTDSTGRLIGMITNQSIIRMVFYTGGNISPLVLSVEHCLANPAKVEPEMGILDAIDLLDKNSAICVVKDDIPLAILTYTDINLFFRNLSEGLILVEDIEVTLRLKIEEKFPDPDKLVEALAHILRHPSTGEPREVNDLSDLSFYETIQFICHKTVWPKFKSIFEHKDIFQQYMHGVREIRNQLVHFRGDLEPVQKAQLRTAHQWLETRTRFSSSPEKNKILESQSLEISKWTSSILNQIENINDVISEDISVSGIYNKLEKYDKLRFWLETECEDKDEVLLKFEHIEEITGYALPRSALVHRAWWSNDPSSHSQSRAWMSAGWVVNQVDIESKIVNFKQDYYARMQVMFSSLVSELKDKRPEATTASKPSRQNWFSFSARSRGMNFAWVFNIRGELSVELYIDRGKKEVNKAIFDKLHKQKEEIEQKIGEKLRWERLNDKRASRISIGIPINIDQPLSRVEEEKKWALDTMVKFLDTFKPLIRDI